jgi:hypothetical protein
MSTIGFVAIAIIIVFASIFIAEQKLKLQDERARRYPAP